MGHLADDPTGPSTDAVVAPSFAADDPGAPGAGPAAADPTTLAETVIAEARDGASVVRLCTGDPLTRPDVITEVRAVAAAGVPFDVVPGMPAATAVPAYAGVALGAAHTTVDLTGASAIDYASLAVAPARSCCRRARTSSPAPRPRWSRTAGSPGRPPSSPRAAPGRASAPWRPPSTSSPPTAPTSRARW